MNTMRRKHISVDELNWIVQEELMADVPSVGRVPVAVVPDDRQRWRILLPKPDGRNAWNSKISKRILAIEQRLKEKYYLKWN